MRLCLTPGQQGDCLVAEALLAELPARALVADRAYDTDKRRAYAAAHRIPAVIPAKRCRKHALPHDRALYRERNHIERFVNHLKQCRRIATRYEKTATCFLAFAQLASVLIWLR